MNLITLLLIVLVVLAFTGGHVGWYGQRVGYGGGGLLLIILIVLLLAGRI